MKKYIAIFMLLLFSCKSEELMKVYQKPDIGLDAMSTLGVVALVSSPPESGKAISDAIGTGLISSNIKIIERTFLNKILEEHGLAFSGATDDIEFKKIGKLLSLDYLLIGSATTLTRASAGGTKWRITASEYTCITSVSIRIVDVWTGEVIIGLSYTVPKDYWIYPNLIGDEIAKRISKELTVY